MFHSYFLRRSLLAALTHILFPVTISIRNATGRERFITILAIDVWAHCLLTASLYLQYKLYLHIMREEKILGNGREKKPGNSWEREVKDIGFLGRTLQTSSFQKHLSKRSSKLVLSHSIMVFHLCFQSCTHNNIETNTWVSKCECALLFIARLHFLFNSKDRGQDETGKN